MNRTEMCMDEQFDRIERMLEWLIKFNHINQPEFIEYKKKQLPDIDDILKEEKK